MKLWDWLQGKNNEGDVQPYAEPPDRPATPLEIYLLCAAIHCSLSILLPIAFFTLGGRVTETSVGGAPGVQGTVDTLPAEIGFALFHIIQFLQWPMSWILGFFSALANSPMMTGWLGYVPVILNSLLWGVPIYYGYLLWQKWRSSRK